MEKNANLHRDVGGSSLCTTLPGETGDITTVGGVKGSTDACKKKEPSLSTLVSSSCNASSTTIVSHANAISTTEKSDIVSAMTDSRSLQDGNAQSTGLSETTSEPRDQLSNGMEYSPPSATGNNQGVTSKLVNKPTEGEPPGMEAPAPGITSTQPAVSEGVSVEQAKLSKPTRLAPGNTNEGNARAGVSVSSERAVSEGAPSGSDHSIAGESRSFDSLESFSNLNSCPSSEPTSEGLEDKGLALALQQNEYGVDGGKVPVSKDRGAGQSIYHIKWIKWKEENTPIITQNENGPCPLLAIMNVLLLAWKVNTVR